MSADGVVATANAVWRQDELPELVRARPEGCSRDQQIVLPHTVEALTILFPEQRISVPVLVEVPEPRHQGPVVVGAEVVPVLNDEQPLKGIRKLARRRDERVREDVLANPWVSGRLGPTRTDGVQQEQATGPKETSDFAQKRTMVLCADMLKHTQGDDVVVGPLGILVILQKSHRWWHRRR